jgi:hypothetical protein
LLEQRVDGPGLRQISLDIVLRVPAEEESTDMWSNHFICQDAGFCNGSWGRASFKVEVN